MKPKNDEKDPKKVKPAKRRDTKPMVKDGLTDNNRETPDVPIPARLS